MKISFLHSYLVPPIFEEQLQDVCALLQSNITLSVKVRGFPEPEMQWKKNGVAIKKSKKCSIHQAGPVTTLKIDKVTLDDEDTYSVVAKNCSGEAVSSCKLTIQGKENDYPFLSW